MAAPSYDAAAAHVTEASIPSPSPAAATPGTSNPAIGLSTPYPQVVGGFGAAGDVWYESERTAIRHMESEIEAIDARMQVAESEIQRLKRNIDAAEGGYGVYAVGDPEYATAIRRHNRLVEEFNVDLNLRRTTYADYEARLRSFNARVDAHNARR